MSPELLRDLARGHASEAETRANVGRWSSRRNVPTLTATQALAEMRGHATAHVVNVTPERVEAWLRALGRWEP